MSLSSFTVVDRDVVIRQSSACKRLILMFILEACVMLLVIIICAI